jgi:hypothetical protein
MPGNSEVRVLTGTMERLEANESRRRRNDFGEPRHGVQAGPARALPRVMPVPSPKPDDDISELLREAARQTSMGNYRAALDCYERAHLMLAEEEKRARDRIDQSRPPSLGPV